MRILFVCKGNKNNDFFSIISSLCCTFSRLSWHMLLVLPMQESAFWRRKPCLQAEQCTHLHHSTVVNMCRRLTRKRKKLFNKVAVFVFFEHIVFSLLLVARRSYDFGMTWGWVINDSILIFGWTCPLIQTWALYSPWATSGPLAILDRPSWGRLIRELNINTYIGVIKCTQYNRAAFIFKATAIIIRHYYYYY